MRTVSRGHRGSLISNMSFDIYQLEVDRACMTLFEEKASPIHMRPTDLHLKKFLDSYKLQDINIAFKNDIQDNVVTVAFAFKTTNGKLQKNVFRYKTDPVNTRSLLFQRCDSLEDENGALISTNYSSDMAKAKIRKRSSSGHKPVQCRSFKKAKKSENDALIQSVRSKVLQNSSSNFSLILEETEGFGKINCRRRALDSVNCFYRKFRRGMSYRKLSAVY